MAGLHWSEIEGAFEDDSDGTHGHVKTFRKAHAKAGASAGSNPRVARAMQRRADAEKAEKIAAGQQSADGEAPLQVGHDDSLAEAAKRAAADARAAAWVQEQLRTDRSLRDRWTNFTINGQPVTMPEIPVRRNRVERQADTAGPADPQAN